MHVGIDLADRVWSVAQIAAAQFGGQLANDWQIDCGHLVGDRGVVADEIAIGAGVLCCGHEYSLVLVLDVVKGGSYSDVVSPSDLRATVLQAAVDFIAKHGPDGLSFRQVAAAAGVSHQAPYHHFTDRQGIFQAIALEGFTQFAAALRAAEQSPDMDASTALVESYIEFALENVGHFRVMFRSDLTGIQETPELARVADESFDVLVNHVQKVLGPKASVEQIRDRVVAMWSMAHGLATLLIDGPLEDKVGNIADRGALIRAVAQHSGLAGPMKKSR